MKKLAGHIGQSFDANNEQAIQIRKAIRAGEVRRIWEELVEDYILEHTNGVYILNEDDKRIMKVYVDESIYASELNNRRELIQLLCNERFGEVIDEFQIFISYGNMKKVYPFKKEGEEEADKLPAVPLSAQEKEEVEQYSSVIKNERLREKFKKAMTADLEWKKGNPQ